MATKKRKCGWFTHYKFVKTRRVDKIQHWKCTNCGRLKRTKAKYCFLGMHQYRLDRRSKKQKVLRCKRCPASKVVKNV